MPKKVTLERNLEDVVKKYISKKLGRVTQSGSNFALAMENLTFLVEDEEFNSGSKTMEQRSDGFRWFVSFLLTVASDHSDGSSR